MTGPIYRLIVLATLCAPVWSHAQDKLLLSELMYHPVERAAFDSNGAPVLDISSDVHEFIELHNAGLTPVNLTGWSLAGGIDFDFPAGTVVPAAGFVLVAKDPARLAAIAQYALTPNQILGPYAGQLSNDGDTVRLRNALGDVVDSVSYSPAFPWAISADGLGADDEWTGIDSSLYQYRGRSLERVSFEHPANSPANWLASPLASGPTPGRSNTVQLTVPRPVVTALSATEMAAGGIIIRSNRTVRVQVTFSATNQLLNVSVEYFLDNINATNETRFTLVLSAIATPSDGRYTGILPMQPDRSVVRYRVRADRGAGVEAVSPRPDDPFGWHAYFVTPTRTAANPVYDCFLSTASLNTLATNINQAPRRIIAPDPPGNPRVSWNDTEPAIFVLNGEVFDIQMRHHGSRYNRNPGRNSFKWQFPRYRRFAEGRESFFVTDKGEEHRVGGQLYDAADLPAWRCRYVDLYLNSNARLQRLQQDEVDEELYRRWAEEQATRYPGREVEGLGGVFKATGVIPFETGSGQGLATYQESGEGPYYIGNCALPPVKPGWNVVQRCEWTYGPQINGWKGGADVAELLAGLWAARGDSPTSPNPGLGTLRPFLATNFDVDATLTYIAIRDWSGPFDNATHNHFLWRRADGRWGMLPWDLDSEFDNPPQTIFWDEQVPAQPDALRGPHWIKDSFYKAFRNEYKQKLWLLNNTLLNPADFATNGWGSLQSFANSRFTNVNSQLGLGVFQRPTRPTNITPANGQSVTPPAILSASPYAHSMNPAPAHGTTTWMIRHVNGTYSAPVYRVTTSSNLSSLPIPFASLTFGERYFWRCLYTDTNGHPSVASLETSFLFGGAAVPGNVRLNEILTDNRQTITNGNTVPDYIELYNSSDQTQNLNALSLTDDVLVPDRFLFPSTATIPPRSYLIVWCDRDTNAPGLHTGFALDNDGQRISMFAATPNGYQLTDTVTFGLQLRDRSIGRVGSDWVLNIPTPAATNQPAALGSVATLKINEWMASATTSPDWFELFNPDSLPVALAGLFVSDDSTEPMKSSLAALTFIDGHGHRRFFADQDLEQGARHVNFRLSVGGDSIYLAQTNGLSIDAISFGNQAVNVSQGRLPDGAANIASFPGSDSPEDVNRLPILNVVINEVGPDVELFNPGAAAVTIGGWWISDQPNVLEKYQVAPDTLLEAGAYLRIAAVALPFQFDLIRGGVVILSHDGTHQTSVDYGPHDGHSYGTVLTSVDRDFGRLSTPTFGSVNAPPKVGPVVISEVQYHPPDLPGDNDDYEFVELANIAAMPADLFLAGFPDRPWRLRDAVSFTFPPNTSLGVGERILVLGFNPVTNTIALSNFLAVYNIPGDVRLFGPYSGNLANDGDSVELVQDQLPITVPGPDYGNVPAILMDRVNYADNVPWPSGADGFGPALQRRVLSSYGNEPTNWVALAATPGSPNVSNAPPAVVLTSPSNGNNIGFNQPITISATANDGDGTVRLLELFVDGAPLHATFSSAVNFLWTNAPPGAHVLTTRATDNNLGRATSAPVNITVSNQLPIVTLLSPLDGTALMLPTNITLEATATDADGVVLKIEFYDNGLRLGQGVGNPATLPLINLRPGTHRFTATATDDGGGVATSAVATVTASRASYIAYAVPAGTIGTQPFGGGLGMDFTVVTPILVTALGVFDSGADGIMGGTVLTAQLYARNGNAGTVLATLSFTAGSAGVLIDSSRFKPLATPLLLNPGTYCMTAYGFDGANLEGNIGTGSAKTWSTEDGGGLIAFVGTSRFGTTGNAPGTFPATPDGGPVDRYAAGTFEFRNVPNTPVVVVNPTNTYVNPGANAVFTVGAAGAAPLRYQWSVDGTNLLGETNASLTIANAQLSRRGFYRVAVSNSFGIAVSEPALLDILIEPIIVQPPLSQLVVTGANVTLSVVVTNTATLPIGYRWRRGGTTLNFVTLTQYTAFFTVTNIQPPSANYTVVVTNIAKPGGNLSANATLTFGTDTDGDGIPDSWENAFGLNPNLASDAAFDSDADGASNRAEYDSGTNPTNAASRLKIESFSAGGGAMLSFLAASNKTYSVHYTEDRSLGPWQVLEFVPARSTNRLAVIFDPVFTTNRFYRIATPQ